MVDCTTWDLVAHGIALVIWYLKLTFLAETSTATIQAFDQHIQY